MGKRNVSDIETGAGFFMGFVNELMDVVRGKEVPFAAIYRLATSGGRETLGKMVDVALADWDGKEIRAQQVMAVPPKHYRLYITHHSIPSVEDPKKEGGEESVFGDHLFTLHESCKDMDRTSGERIFYVHRADRNWKGEEQIAWGLRQRTATAPNGYRPATHEETYQFAKAHPEFKELVGLGSMTDSYVALMDRYGQDGDGPLVVRLMRFYRFSALQRIRILFVCK